MEEEQVFELLRTRLWNLELEHPLVLGAGVAKYIEGPEGLEGFLSSANASLLIGGSFTVSRRAGNPGEVCWSSADGAVTMNRMGLPNQGITELTERLPGLISSAHRNQRLVGISVAAGCEPEISLAQQYEVLAKAAFDAGADLVELNLSCPNTESDVIAFNLPDIREIVEQLERALDGAKHNVCMKVSPYSQSRLIQDVAQLVNASSIIKGVSAINTFPNALRLENGAPVITSNDGLAGLSGPCLFPIALGQVAQWRKHLAPEKYILGGGGVTTVQNVLDMRKAGADAVFLVSAVLTQKPRIFNELLDGLVEHYSRM
jgi:dihydroorotate dehydrogenase